MESKEQNLKGAFEYVKTFYNEVAQMMTDLIELMDKKGWAAEKGTITDGLSYALDLPDKWMAFYIFKNFINTKIKDSYYGVVIFFDEDKSDFPISIVCGRIQSQVDKLGRWDLYWLAKNHKDKLSKLTGEVIELKDEYEEGNVSGKVFAIPLTSINNKEDINERIVNKLLDIR